MRTPILIAGACVLALTTAACHKPAQENAVESQGNTSTANVMAPSNGTGGDATSGGNTAVSGDAGGGNATGSTTTTGNVSSGGGASNTSG